MRRGADAVMVIAGRLYAQAIAAPDRLEITQVHLSAEGDSVFPDRSAIWRETARTAHSGGRRTNAAYDVVTYMRRKDG